MKITKHSDFVKKNHKIILNVYLKNNTYIEQLNKKYFRASEIHTNYMYRIVLTNYPLNIYIYI